jgi:hypothetical protein
MIQLPLAIINDRMDRTLTCLVPGKNEGEHVRARTYAGTELQWQE